MKTIKLYGQTVTTWTINNETNTCGVCYDGSWVWNHSNRAYQIEVEYTEYLEDGTPVGEGTIDYTKENCPDIAFYSIYTWDGKTMTKDGSKRRFENSYRVRIDRKDRKYLPQIVKSWNSNIAEISIRK